MRSVTILAAVVVSILPACAQPQAEIDPPEGGAIEVNAVEVTDPIDRQILDAYLAHVETLAAYCTPERMAQFAAQPEDIVWQGSQYIRVAYVAYLLTADAKYLDMFVERMDTLCDQLTTGPDGKRGWYGLAYDLFRHPDHPDRAVDVQITSFQIAGMLADFARVVEGDEALQATYGAKVEEYLSLAQELVDKWEARGSYHDLGLGGAVYTTHTDLHPIKGDLTLYPYPFNQVVHPVQTTNKGALAAAGRPDQGKDAVGRDHKRHILYRLEIPVEHGKVSYLHLRLGILHPHG